MNTSHRISSGNGNLPLVETLEDRRLLSASIGPIGPIAPVLPPAPIVSTSAFLLGEPIHAEANQAFKAVLGTIQDVKVPAGYTLSGTIHWGDGSGSSAATFTHLADGAIEVVGSHTYTGVGTDAITVTLTESPASGTTLPIILVGTLKTIASVISSPGGVTLEETADVPFTGTVGTFSSTLSLSSMTAIITWGDGRISVGKILAAPVTPDTSVVGGALFIVSGTHVYARSGSYAVHVTVTSSPVVPPPVTTSAATAEPPIIILVAEIDSVIDVLSALPVAVPVTA